MEKKERFGFDVNYNITFTAFVEEEDEKAARKVLTKRLKEWEEAEGGLSFTIPDIEDVDIDCADEELVLSDYWYDEETDEP